MKKFKTKLLAILLSAAMVILQSGQVFAVEAVPEQQVGVSDTEGQEEISEAETVPEQQVELSKDEVQEELPEADTVQEQQVEVSGEEAREELSEAETIQEQQAEISEEGAQEKIPEAETWEVQDAEQEAEETISDNAAEEGELSFELKGMPEGYCLSEEQLKGKKNIMEHDVLSVMDTLTAGEDYIEDEVIFSCDDPEYAEVVAQAYNGTLKSCEYGIAVIKLDTSLVTVEEAVEAGADTATVLPPVDANYLTKLTDPVLSGGTHAEEYGAYGSSSTMSAKKHAIDKRNWSYWSKIFNDPALDPGYTFTDPDDDEIKRGYQWMHDAIGTYAAWGVTQGEGVTVAVIDTGVYADHPDLRGQVTEERNVMASSPVDNNGHGTHVAGIIASAANTVGGVGVAPKAKIIGYPVFGEGGADNADGARAINDVVNGGNPRAQVINMSLGGPGYSQTMQDVIDKAYEAGVTICVAMGNQYANNVNYPAAYDHVIAVSALDESFQKSDFSTSGSWADIAAPGTAIYSTWNGHGGEDIVTNRDYWASWNGTSMACPVVAGVCALYISAKGGRADPGEVEKAIKKTATKVSSSYKIGAGMVDAAALLRTMEDTSAPKIDVPSTVSADSIITLSDSNAAGGTLGFIYTINGKKPSAVSGEVKQGFYVEASNGAAAIPVSELLDRGLVVNEASKLTVARITGLGTMTELATESITLQGNAATGVMIIGSDFLARGKSLTYKLNRKLPKNTSVKWKLEGAPAGVTINAKSGKVSSKAGSSGDFTIVAEIGGGRAVKTVKLVDGATSLTLLAPVTDKELNIPVTGKNGNLKSARLYNVDVKDTERVENVLKLEVKIVGNEVPVEYISSKPSVASVDSTGKVTAQKAGTVKITCKTTDGSNKQVSVSIKVIVPVSGLDMFLDKDMEAIAYGKTMKVRAAIGSAYGTPTIKKLVWDREPVQVIGLANGDEIDVTSKVRGSDYISVINGKIRVDKKIKNLDDYNCFKVTVKVKATDGSGISKEKSFIVVPPTSFMKSRVGGTQRVQLGYGGEIELFAGDLGWEYIRGTGGKVLYPDIISSNPAVASTYISGFGKYGEGLDGISYKCFLVCEKRGTTKVTIKATDGTGKKVTVKIIVY